MKNAPLGFWNGGWRRKEKGSRTRHSSSKDNISMKRHTKKGG
jgi:hypothetical protein